MTNFSEMLGELIKENHLSQKALAQRIGVSESRISEYLRKDKLPTVKNLIGLADCFQCSADFLLGLAYESTRNNFHPPVPLAERIVYLTQIYGYTPKRIFAESQIEKSRYYQWIKGERQPSLENVMKLAKLFGCSVDLILGRET